MALLQPLLMPKLGLTMTEGALAEWRVAPGDAFGKGDVLFVVETDKIANEIEAEAAGRLVEILVPAGEIAEVGALLGRAEFESPQAVGPSPVTVPQPAGKAEGQSRNAASPAPMRRSEGARIVATPLARRLAREGGIDLASVAGSGPRGRVKADDVRSAPQATPEHPASPAADAGAGAAVRPVALTRPQLVASRRTSRSKAEIPHFYLTATVAVDALEALRAKVNGAGTWPKTTLTHWVTAAIGRALADHPEARRVWRGDGAVELTGTAVGVVADVDGNLFIPVVADAGIRTLGAISASLSDLVARAGEGALRREDMEGAAVSLSNLGMYGVDSVTPVIELDQGMIVGAGRASRVFRPGSGGEPVAASEMVLTLACDHRVHNGVSAARFLGRIVTYLQEPMRLLMPPVANP